MLGLDKIDACTIGLMHHEAIRDCQKLVVSERYEELEQFFEGSIYKTKTDLDWGAICKIVGYALEYVGRDKPGVPGFYERLLSPEIEIIADADSSWLPDEPRRIFVHSHSLMAYDQDTYRQRLRELLPQVGKLSQRGKLIHPPPETAFWEGDWVRVREGVERGKRPISSDKRHGGAIRVCSMNFEAPLRHPTEFNTHDQFYEFPEMPARYILQDAPYTCWSAHWGDTELELVERGNIWRQAHNEPLQFADLIEEALFHYDAGKYVAVPDPKTGKTYWYEQNEAATLLLNQGVGDVLECRYYDMDPSDWSILKFEDEELGRRLRKASERGFVMLSEGLVREFRNKPDVIETILAAGRAEGVTAA